jgi:hypothetical protein
MGVGLRSGSVGLRFTNLSSDRLHPGAPKILSVIRSPLDGGGIDPLYSSRRMLRRIG